MPLIVHYYECTLILQYTTMDLRLENEQLIDYPAISWHTVMP